MVSDRKIINQESFIKGKILIKIPKSKNLVMLKNCDFPSNSKNMGFGWEFLILRARLAFTK